MTTREGGRPRTDWPSLVVDAPRAWGRPLRDRARQGAEERGQAGVSVQRSAGPAGDHLRTCGSPAGPLRSHAGTGKDSHEGSVHKDRSPVFLDRRKDRLSVVAMVAVGSLNTVHESLLSKDVLGDEIGRFGNSDAIAFP